VKPCRLAQWCTHTACVRVNLAVQVVYASARRMPFAGVDITKYVAGLLTSRWVLGAELCA